MVNSAIFFSKYGEFMPNFPPVFFPTCHHVNEVNWRYWAQSSAMADSCKRSQSCTYKIPVWECFPCLVLHAILWFWRPTALWKLELAWSQSQLPSVLAPGKTIFCSSLWCLNVNYSCVCTVFQMNYPLLDQQENGVFWLATIKHLQNIIADDKKYGLHHYLIFFLLWLV